MNHNYLRRKSFFEGLRSKDDTILSNLWKKNVKKSWLVTFFRKLIEFFIILPKPY
jgi:hypothetical protein